MSLTVEKRTGEKLTMRWPALAPGAKSFRVEKSLDVQPRKWELLKDKIKQREVTFPTPDFPAIPEKLAGLSAPPQIFFRVVAIYGDGEVPGTEVACRCNLTDTEIE